MALNLFDLFKFSKTLTSTDGKLLLMNTPINIIPTAILCELQKGMIQALGFEKAYQQIYETTKQGSVTYNKDFIKFHGFQEKRKIVDWQWKIVTFSGWGKWQIIHLDLKENTLAAKFEESPFAKEYGKSKYPVDIIPVAFSAGGIAACFGTDLDCIETKCMAMGDPFCEIFIGPPKMIEEKKQALWRKWQLI